MLQKLFPVVAAGLTLMACASQPTPTIAGEQPNILVMGEDADKDTVPRNSRVFKRVLDAMAQELVTEGFKVYDEVAVSLDDFAQGRTRRTDAEIIDVSRKIKRPPIDVTVMFQIYASAKKLSYTTEIRARITGRLLNVRSGERLGNFEVKLEPAETAPVDCNRECILEVVGKHGKELGHDLGAVLAKKLDWLSPTKSASAQPATTDSGGQKGMSHAYSMVFTGFSPEDITEIEEFIVAFKGYEHHRPVKSSLRTNEYWYETSSDAARLNRNLRIMLDHLAMEGRVTYAGNSFKVEKIAKPKKR